MELSRWFLMPLWSVVIVEHSSIPEKRMFFMSVLSFLRRVSTVWKIVSASPRGSWNKSRKWLKTTFFMILAIKDNSDWVPTSLVSSSSNVKWSQFLSSLCESNHLLPSQTLTVLVDKFVVFLCYSPYFKYWSITFSPSSTPIN